MNTATLITLLDDSDSLVEQELLNFYTTHFSDQNLETLESAAGKISAERVTFYYQLTEEYKKAWFNDCLLKVLADSSIENIDLIIDTLLSMNCLFDNGNSIGSSKQWIANISNEVSEKSKSAKDDAERLFILSQSLFFQNKLNGNHQNYYDPQNSDLSTVIKTRLGIPISLSMVTYIISRKVGIQCLPANIPRHFMLYFPFEVPTYMDCFNIGSLLPPQDIEIFLGQINITKQPSEFLETNFLVILKRWLQNIVYIYSSRNEVEKLTILYTYIDQINSALGINDLSDR